MATAGDVFISYASDTKPLAEELTRALETQGIEPWVDFRNLRPGQRWPEELERAVENAEWFLILVGAHSRATLRQEAEWSAALTRTWADREKRLLPIVFGQGEPPPFLRNWVPLRVNPEAEALTWTRRVVDELRSHRDEAGHRLPKGREERQNRLEEIRQAVEALREADQDIPPARPEPSR